MELVDVEIIRKRNSRVRKHGWSFPWHPYQIWSWIFYCSTFTFYYFVLMISILHNIIAVWLCTFTITVLMVLIIVLDTKATIFDPTDESVKNKNQHMDDSSLYSFYWKIWQSHVSECSKHWGQWNRWVADFDHHCKWLNNWVGKINYKLFITLCITIMIYHVVFIIISVYVIVEYWTNKDKFIDSIKLLYSTDCSILFVALTSTMIVVNTVPLVAISNLMLFHIWLYK